MHSECDVFRSGCSKTIGLVYVCESLSSTWIQISVQTVDFPLSRVFVCLSASIFHPQSWTLAERRTCVCMKYSAWPERRYRLQFSSCLCLPPRMKPYRIMSTLRLLLPQHPRLACHNTDTGREAGEEGESAGSVTAPLFCLCPQQRTKFIPSAAPETMLITQLFPSL